jgi:hypothetical protein
MFTFNNNKKIDKEINKTAEMAKHCINSDIFAEYKKKYEVLEKVIVDSLLIEAKNFCGGGENLEKFGAKCLVRLTKLGDLRAIINDVTKDAGE